MPRPKNKEELVSLSQEKFTKLIHLVDNLPPEKLNTDFVPGTLNRNVRDVLAHMHHWNEMMLGWYKEGMAGKKPVMPAVGYTWKTLPDLNQKIWEKYKTADLKKIRKDFEASFKKLFKLINSHSDEELFTKKKYNWTGSTNLAAYLISSTSSHYDWAIKFIMKKTK